MGNRRQKYTFLQESSAFTASQREKLRLQLFVVAPILANGRKVKVQSAAFVWKRKNTVGRPPHRGRNVFFHPALELFGFIDKKSPEYLSTVVRTAVSCSSFQAASTELEARGINICAEQIRKLTYKYADLFMVDRIHNTLDGSEKQAGLILEITADGGRTRMRENVKLKNKVKDFENK